MSSPESTTPDSTPQPCALAGSPYYAPGPTAEEKDLANHSWMVATIIEDDDLMFGGKPLCAWYEEDRRRLSAYVDEEETRGRQRERVRVDAHHHHKPHHQGQHQHQHQHHRHLSKKSSEAKK